MKWKYNGVVNSIFDTITYADGIWVASGGIGGGSVYYSTRRAVYRSDVPSLVGNSLNSVTLLGSYARQDTASTTVEEFTVTLSEGMDNFAMLYVAVVADIYILGSSLIPITLFKTQMPNASVESIFELNFINDQQDLFGGNVQYLSDTSIKGNIVGNATHLLVYGIGKTTD